MAEKYCTYSEAARIALSANETPPTVPNNIKQKLITKENLTTYKCKISNIATINYTDKQCVLRKDIIPLNSYGSTINLALDTSGALDFVGEYAFYYVTDPGPFEGTRIDDYTSMYYPTNALPVLYPFNATYTHTTYDPIGGSSLYRTSDGIDYVKYGLGIEGWCEIYSHGTGNNFVFMDIACWVYFLDGSYYQHTKRVYPSSTTIEYQDANETVYKHVFDTIHFNNVAGAGFINCGAKQVKNIISSISIFGDA